MKVESRLILTFLVRLSFLVFAGWVLIIPDTLPGSPYLVRIGMAATLVVVAILVGEVVKLQTQFEMLLKALRQGVAKVTGDQAPKRDDNAAVGILIRALGSREENTREKAHANLVRISGQQLPPDQAAWEAWWKERQEQAAAE